MGSNPTRRTISTLSSRVELDNVLSLMYASRMTKKCLSCDTELLWRMKTPEGRFVQMGTRKLCLQCSPLGSRAGNRLIPKPFKKLEEGSEVKCSCGRIYLYNKSKGHSVSRCNSCLVNSRRPQHKLEAIAYKGGKCQRCGYDKCVRALVFHHIDPTRKDFSP